MRFYPDACVIIYLVERHAGLYEHVKPRFDAALRDGHTLATSELARMECRVGPLKVGDTAALEDFDRFFSHFSQHWCSWPRTVFDRAAEFRVTHRLKAIDALHLAAAIDSSCDEFWTNDTRLAAAAGAHLSVIDITQATP